MTLILSLLTALLVGVVVFAIVVLRARFERARQRSAEREAEFVASVAGLPDKARSDVPKSPWHLDDSDSEATRVHMRTTQGLAAAPRARTGNANGGAPASARLVGLSGCQKGNSFELGAAGLTVGRHATNDIVLVDVRVSSHHAWIGVVKGRVVLRDLESTNGTYLNAQTQVAVGEVELRSGDTIFFGGHRGEQFRFVAD